MESGANPDSLTTEGLVAGELAGNKGYAQIQELIESFSK